MELAELCERLRRQYLAGVCDALYELGLPERLLSTRLRPLFPEQRLVGAAFTVAGREFPPVGWDAGIVRMRPYLEAFEQLEPDSVIVSVTGGERHVGHFGELTANAAQHAGCVGCILDGNLRDVEGLREIGFQVFYSGLSPLNGIGRWEMIECQQPVLVDGVTINPGDIVFAEFEGILVIPRSDAERALLKAEEIVAAEGLVRADVRAGATPSESLDRHGHI